VKREPQTSSLLTFHYSQITNKKVQNEKKRAYVGNRDRKVEVVEYTTEKNALNEDVPTESSIGFF